MRDGAGEPRRPAAPGRARQARPVDAAKDLEIIRAPEREGAAYIVFGAVALDDLGVSRATRDHFVLRRIRRSPSAGPRAAGVAAGGAWRRAARGRRLQAPVCSVSANPSAARRPRRLP
jgi:hypothetical protein